VRILWKEYRNSAVHESSTYKDEAPDVSGENEEPFYAHVNIYEDGRIARDEIRFAIPNVFILASLRRCIDDFKKYLQDGNIDLRKNLNRQ